MLVSGMPATKPDRLVADSEPIEFAGPRPRYVSRGGDKLEGALSELRIFVEGKRCLDIGSSTGGFTDCLLQHGAASVIAVDVGRNQLDWSMRGDARVTVRERTDVRDLDREELGPLDLVTVDLSFISLRTVMPAIAELSFGADVLALVKPQFEVGRSNVPRGGVVRDEALQRKAIADVAKAAEGYGLVCRGCVPSPISGMQGNREFFLYLIGAR